MTRLRKGKSWSAHTERAATVRDSHSGSSEQGLSRAGTIGGASARSVLPSSACDPEGLSSPAYFPPLFFLSENPQTCSDLVTRVGSGSLYHRPIIPSKGNRCDLDVQSIWAAGGVGGKRAGQGGRCPAGFKQARQPRQTGLHFWASSPPFWWSWEVGIMETGGRLEVEELGSTRVEEDRASPEPGSVALLPSSGGAE